jgi:cytidylate kinase
MMIRAVTIEREFGCGGSEIAARLAELLGWKLWDRELTQEIARNGKMTLRCIVSLSRFFEEHSREHYPRQIG